MSFRKSVTLNLCAAIVSGGLIFLVRVHAECLAKPLYVNHVTGIDIRPLLVT